MKLCLGDGQGRLSAWREPLACFLIFCLTLPLVYGLSRYGYDSHHTALMYKSALDVANGKLLFRETFTQYGALTTLIQALFIKIFGARVLSVQLATAVFYALDYTLLYRLCRRFFSCRLSSILTAITVFLAPFFLWELHPWSSVFALAFLLGALLLLLNALQRGRKAALLLSGGSGLCIALTFWCRQPVGIVCMLAGLLSLGLPAILLWRQKAERNRFLWLLLALFGGIAVGLILFILPLMLVGALEDFYIQSIGGMLNFAGERNGGVYAPPGGLPGALLYNLVFQPVMKADARPLIDAVWMLLPLTAVSVVGYAVVQMILARKKQELDAMARALPYLFYGIFAAGAWHQYHPVGCYRHWYWGAFLCVPAMTMVIKGILHRLFRLPKPASLKHASRWRMAAFVLAMALVFAPAVSVRVISGVQKYTNAAGLVKMESTHRADLNGLYLSPETVAYFDGYFAKINELQAKLPDTPIVNGTENAVFSTFGENFHPLYVNWDTVYPDYDKILLDYITAARPIYIGPEAPTADYVLWYAPEGDCADAWWDEHNLPANIYLPAELLERL